jgi:hypothetical protein
MSTGTRKEMKKVLAPYKPRETSPLRSTPDTLENPLKPPKKPVKGDPPTVRGTVGGSRGARLYPITIMPESKD